MTFKKLVILFVALLLPLKPSFGQDVDMTLAVPAEMLENGFTKHLLPRFGFKARLRIGAVETGETADIAFDLADGAGRPLFQMPSGDPVFLSVRNVNPSVNEMAEKFEDWLRSDPGQAAITGFPSGGPSLYQIATQVVEKEEETEVDGDKAAGSKLALLHCGRCHVVDARNPFGGIGSTPSFPALRGRVGWSDLFLAFWAENPHPSFTQVLGVTEPFDDQRPSHIAPIELTLEDIEAITAYVGTLKAKDLGAAVSAK